MDDIIAKKNQMLEEIVYMPEIFVVLYEEPEGSPRPRARMINRKNISSLAKSNPSCIQVYSITGSSDKKFMKQFISDTDFDLLDSLIYTPCSVKYDVFLKTPSAFNATDTMLAEAGYIRPICKPDFDNIEKKYSDMYTGNIWEDDSLVMHSSVDKYYSVLPRIEIRLRYLNMLYNKYQYKSMKNRVNDPKFFQ